MAFLKANDERTEAVEKLKRYLPDLEDGNQDFCKSLISFYEDSAGLTSNQWYWVKELLVKAEARRKPGGKRECYVYFLGTEKGVRVGFSYDPVNTIKGGYLLQVIKCQSLDEAKTLRRMLHAALWDFNIAGICFSWDIIDEIASDPVAYSSIEGLRRKRDKAMKQHGPAESGSVLQFPRLGPPPAQQENKEC